MRLLYTGYDRRRSGAARQKLESLGGRHPPRHGRQRLSLRNLSANPRRVSPGRAKNEEDRGMNFEPERYELMAGPAYHFSFGRRGFFKALGGGIVVVSFLSKAA